MQRKDDSNLNEPYSAYDGEESYIFVSYAHKDKKHVFPEIRRFQDEGYPIWYDEDLTPGQEWDEEIEEALEKSSLLVVFISKNSMASDNVVDEIKFARDEGINIVLIYLEETKLAKGLNLRLKRKHAIMHYNLTDEKYIKACIKAFDYYGIPILPYKLKPSFPPYEGEDYICVNYSYKDSERIIQELEKFHDQGYNIWYSNEMSSEDEHEWAENMVDHLHRSSLFIVFMTLNSIKVPGIYERVHHALNHKIPILFIYLDDINELYDLMDIKIRDYELDRIQEIEKLNLSDGEYVSKFTELFKEHGLIPK